MILRIIEYMIWILGAAAIGFVYYIILLAIVSWVSPNEMFPGFMQYKEFYWLALSVFAYPQSRKILR